MIMPLLKKNKLLMAAVIMILISIFSVFRQPALKQVNPLLAPPVSPFKNSIAGVGVVEPKTENIDIGTSLAGVVSRIYVQVGQAVKVDDPLFTIDDRDARARLEGAKARMASAYVEMQDADNQLSLFENVKDKRAISKDEITRRRYASQLSHAKLKEAEAQFNIIATEVNRLTVRSPIAGTVLKVDIRPGEYAVAGSLSNKPLMVLGDVSVMHVRVEFDETDALRVKTNAKAVGVLRGYSDKSIPLNFVRVEPLLGAKKTLTNDSGERVDTRVMNVIYAFDNKKLGAQVGQNMDVFVENHQEK
jgi:HlyD family secretion protein